MKKIYFALLILSGFNFFTASAQTICNGSGNIVIFSNYDGGVLNINVDQNIPNLKIGIVAYEAVTVNISGTFVGNVDSVIFAGYPSTNSNHCTGIIPNTTISGVSSSIVSILAYPAATLSNPNGYGSIICAYSCDNTTNQGGCNTADQIQDYFETRFGGTIFSHHIQYNCWLSATTYLVSAGGNCCPTASQAPVADFSISDNTICEGDCISFTDLSTNIPTSWSWSFQGSPTISSTLQNPSNICFPTIGNLTVTLTATNAFGSSMSSYVISVSPLPAAPTINQVGGSLQSSLANSYQWYLNGNPISGATNSTYTFTANGSYTVVITDASGCSSTSAPFVVNNVSVDEYDLNFYMLYPNPTRDVVYLRVSNAIAIDNGVILDINGKTVKTFPVNAKQVTLSISELETGTYFLQLSGEGKVYSRKLVVR